MTEREDPAFDALRAALARTRGLGGREVRFGPEGVVLVDAAGTVRPLLVDGGPHVVDVALLRRAFLEPWLFQGVVGEKDGQGGREVEGHGIWRVGGEGDVLTLRAKKPVLPVLDFLFDADPVDMALLRASYGVPGCEIFVVVEGDTRARDVASTMLAERRLAGLRTEQAFLSVAPDPWRSSSEIDETVAGPSVFDEDEAAGATCRISWMRRGREGGYRHQDPLPGLLLSEGRPDISEVRVGTAVGYERGRNFGGHVRDRLRPTAYIHVGIENSRPVASFAFSESFRAAVADRPVDPEAPWTVLAARRAVRSAARPKAPKTWHQTTAAVAEAFVAREAPRGLISGRSLYFHGPLAYSSWSANPVAAIVDVPGGGRPLLFVGRAEGIGGTLAATVSGAQGDVLTAARGRYEILGIGSIDDFVRIGDVLPREFAYRVERKKSEADHPSTCRIDGPALAATLERWLEEGEAALEKSLKTKFPTGVQASAYARLAWISRTRDLLAPFVDVELPDVPDPEPLLAKAEAVEREARLRSDRLRERKEVWNRVDAETAAKEKEERRDSRDPFGLGPVREVDDVLDEDENEDDPGYGP